MARGTLDIGVVSTDTLRHADLIPTFLQELESVWPEQAEEIRREYADVLSALDSDDDALDGDDALRDDADYMLDSLSTALEDCAPPFCYFGTQEGDGACIGCFPDEYGIGDAIDDGRLIKVGPMDDLPEELPEDAEGTLVLSDHGNMTLYDRDGTEIWGIV